MNTVQYARRYYNLAEKRHAAAQVCGRYDMSPRQTLRMYRAAENLRKWGGILRRAEQDALSTRRPCADPFCDTCGDLRARCAGQE
jgi:hypothetical protein